MLPEKSVGGGAGPTLDSLFRPKSIALVGATDKSLWSRSAYENLTRFGFEGKIHLVNPKGGVIHGQTAAVSCAATGEQIDAALIMVPQAALLATFEDLRLAGITGAVVLSSGFAETGEPGAAKQRELARTAQHAGTRLLGPNCLGFSNYLAKTPIWTTPLRRPMPDADAALAIVSQSGALASQLEQFAHQQRIALTHLVSTGNEADLTVADIIEYLAPQAEVRALAVFLETVRDPPRFIAAIEAARSAGKPVVVFKVGTSEASAKAAQAHTGSLVGNDRAFNAMCRSLGITRVYSLEELIITADLFSRLKPAASGGLALLAFSGGLCEIVNDRTAQLGLPLAHLNANTLGELRTVLPPLATPANPLDLTGAAMLEPALIADSIKAIAKDPAVGMLAFVFDLPINIGAGSAAGGFIAHIAAGFAAASKPALLLSHASSIVSGEARAFAREHRIDYSGGGVHLAMLALAHLFRERDYRASTASAVAPLPGAARPRTERDVLDHLAAHGVPVIPATLAGSAEEAAAAARQAGGPVALKIASADILHKTEAGGVQLNLSGDAQVRAGFDAIRQRVAAAHPGARLDGIIVSPMRTGGVEMYVGTLRDPEWGPCIAVGLGGVWVEALGDTSLRLLPIVDSDALDMLNELRGGTLLDGFRGAPAVDRAALARGIVAIGNAALSLGPQLAALEVNPLLATGTGVEALDGLAVWTDA